HVVGGERDLRGEAGQLALPQQVGTAALAADDPAVLGVAGQRAPGRPRRERRPGLGDQVHRLVPQPRGPGPPPPRPPPAPAPLPARRRPTSPGRRPPPGTPPPPGRPPPRAVGADQP